MSIREQLLSLETPTRVVQVKGWPPIRIRQVPFGMMLDGEAENLAEEVGDKIAPILICCVDDAGEPLFTADDVPFLKSRPTSEILELLGHVAAINGTGDEGVEDVAKNCESSPGDSAS
jgi:hypothetical protein